MQEHIAHLKNIARENYRELLFQKQGLKLRLVINSYLFNIELEVVLIIVFHQFNLFSSQYIKNLVWHNDCININLFHATDLFLHTLKTENLWCSDFFQALKKDQRHEIGKWLFSQMSPTNNATFSWFKAAYLLQILLVQFP